MPPPLRRGIKKWCCLTSVCLSVYAYIGPKSTKKRPRKTKIGIEVAPRHTWLGHHFQGQKFKCQLAGGGGILWRQQHSFLQQQYNYVAILMMINIDRDLWLSDKPLITAWQLHDGWRHSSVDINQLLSTAAHWVQLLFACYDVTMTTLHRQASHIVSRYSTHSCRHRSPVMSAYLLLLAKLSGLV